jgi:oxygen-independent coproporphyrinogen III oxidase
MHLYVHIPFCNSKCSYCDFNSFPISQFSQETVDEYIDAMQREIHLVRKRINKKQINLRTIYIGGGTPSILNDGHIKKLFTGIRENFGITGSLEFTIECNPETVTREKLRFYKGLGANRISLGIQTFNDKILLILERNAFEKDIVKAIDFFKKEGIRNFSFDLIFALPEQTLDMFHEDLEKAVSFEPTHISLYCLTLGHGTGLNFIKKNHKIPDEDTQIKMYQHGVEFLAEKGYARYEISNFAKPGYESRHNLSYWEHKEYIGIGAGASSYMNGYRLKNISEVDKYIESLKTKGNAEGEKLKITPREARSEFVFLSLRLSGGLEFAKYEQKFRSSFLNDFAPFLKDWKGKNMFTLDGERMTLTENGILLSDELFRDLF